MVHIKYHLFLIVKSSQRHLVVYKIVGIKKIIIIIIKIKKIIILLRFELRPMTHQQMS